MAAGDGEKGDQGTRDQVGEGRVSKVTLRNADFILGIGVEEPQDEICALEVTAPWGRGCTGEERQESLGRANGMA